MYYLGEEPLNMTVRVSNRGEPAYDANVYITHPSSLSFIGRKILVNQLFFYWKCEKIRLFYNQILFLDGRSSRLHTTE